MKAVGRSGKRWKVLQLSHSAFLPPPPPDGEERGEGETGDALTEGM